MSKNRRNSHYHYAEKFEDKRKRNGKAAFMPFKAVIASLVVLLMFGLVSTTFGAYMNEEDPASEAEKQPIISEVRNIKASRDIALTGANADLAATGSDWMTMNGGGIFIFDNTNSNWPSVQIAVGRQYSYGTAGVYCRIQSMTRITNTNLYYTSISDWANDGSDNTKIYNVRFMCGSNYNSGNFSPTDSGFLSSCTNYSASFRQNDYTFNSSSVYSCSLASGSNDAAVTIVYRSNGFSYFNYDQKIRSETKNAATIADSNNNSNGGYAQINDGGTISGSGYKLTANNTASASSEADGKVICAKTSSVTLTANPANGYRFVGWYVGGSQITSATAGYTLSGTNNTKITYTVTGAKEVHAKFIAQYTVTVSPTGANKPGTPYIDTSGTTSKTVDAGTSVTLYANPQTNGVSFSSWSFSGNKDFATGSSTSTSTCTITPKANVTATASYTLAAPTPLSFSYDNTALANCAVAGSTNSPAPSYSATPKGNNATLAYSFTGITTKAGTTAAAGTYSVNSSTGVVTASVPGWYTVTMTVTNTAYGLTSTATKTADVVVLPPSPTVFNYVVDGRTDISSENENSGRLVTKPYKIPVGSTTFQVTSTIPEESRGSYYYEWTRRRGYYNTSNGTTTYDTDTYKKVSTGNATENVFTVVDNITDTNPPLYDVVAASDDIVYFYEIKLTQNWNGVASVPLTATVYYGVTADFLTVTEFDYYQFNNSVPLQVVYDEDNTINYIKADYEAGGEAAGHDFNSILMFSSNNINFRKMAVWTTAQAGFTIANGAFAGTYSAYPNDAEHQVGTLQRTMSTIVNLVNLMKTTGVKYFSAFVDDTQNPRISAATPSLHTTVGTSSTVGTRPIYFVDTISATTAGLDLTNTRLMAFFVDGGELKYQSGQNIVDGVYRFYIPKSATKITFAYESKSCYVLPSYDNANGTLTYSANSAIYKGWTPVILLDDSNAKMTTFEANHVTQDGNQIWQYEHYTNGSANNVLTAR